ncbi:MAG: ABC transporter permease subunit [Bacteroidetes bacterium]|nr:ABC transporter permease subunit [Bacteroidota bacterium]
MRTIFKVFQYELRDVVRSKWVILYTLFYLLITDALFRFGSDTSRAMVSLMNIIILLIPLVSIIFGTMYFYNARDFVEMLLSQPIERKRLFIGLFSGLALPLSGGFVLGVCLPFAIHSGKIYDMSSFVMLLASGILLTFIFIALALFISTKTDDKVRGLGISLLVWLFCAVLYDGLIWLIIAYFGDYPLEKAMIGLTIANPVDLARIVIMLKFDIAALMGYTGAVFEKFFGSLVGITIAGSSLILWIVAPLFAGMKLFNKKDF